MRKLMFLSMVVVVAACATGCNCTRSRCGGGLFGRQAAYSQPVMCCPQVQCCDPCSMSGGEVMGSPMVTDGASCCN